jgi:hypothetical protein
MLVSCVTYSSNPEDDNMKNILLWDITPCNLLKSVTEAKRFKECTAFSHLEARIVGSNPTQVMHIWCVYVFILCLCCPVFR